MANFFNRILVAAGLSVSCYFSVEYWYSLQPIITVESSSKKEAARVLTHIKEVQRKPLSHVIWETVSKGDVLFLGEEIRTTANSEATILFKDSNTILELEPDSLIILEESKGILELNFLKGNLFVKSTGGKSKGLRVKSGKSVILTESSEMSLSKRNGKTNLHIFKGAAKLENDGKSKKISKKNSGQITDRGISKAREQIVIKYPTPSDTVYINPARTELVQFKWKKLKPGYSVYLEIGKKRRRLKVLSQTKTPGQKGQLFAPIPLGRFFWKLVAIPDTKKRGRKISSIIISSVSKAKRPALLLSPRPDSAITIFDANESVRFQWSLRDGLTRLQLEIATDKTLKKKVLSKALPKAPSFLNVKLKKRGTYYWRITGYLKNRESSIPVPSLVQRFTLGIGAQLRPPKLISPKDKRKFSLITVLREGLKLNWENVPGMEKYKINIQEIRAFKKGARKVYSSSKEAFGPPLNIKGLNAGTYSWNVISVNRDGKFSKPSLSRKFKVLSLPKLEWALGNGPSTYLYSSPQPSLVAQWKKGRLFTTQWKVRWGKVGELNEEGQEVMTKRPSINLQLDDDGVYELEVEAIGAGGQSTAKTVSKLFTVKERPLLPSPRFSASAPKVYRSNRRGGAQFRWKVVKGAKQYLVELRNKSGQVISKKTVRRSVASFDRMKPGKYGITIKAVDRYNRQGPESEVKQLEVPNRSNISAPKLKGIRVR